MKAILSIMVLVLGAFTWTSFAHKHKPIPIHRCTDIDTSKKKVAPANTKFTPLIACKNAGGAISKAELLKLLPSGLCVINASTKKQYKVLSYEFTYCERGIYEDSLGLPVVLTDYTYQQCKGDSISIRWQKAFSERLIRGDSIKFSDFVFDLDGKPLKIKDRLTVYIQ